jgi:RNA polymerase sigma factor (sigma-70 family)
MEPNELKLFHAGDDRVFATLISTLEPMLRRQIRAYLGVDRDAADDLFQEVCIRMFERRGSYRGAGPLGAWVSRLCARLCVDHSRRENRAERRTSSVDWPFDAPADSRSEFERTREAETAQARLEAITDAVVALSPRKRAMAISHWYFGWPARRIAREFHVTAPTVWTVLSQIRGTLRWELLPFDKPRSLTPI